VRAPVYFLGGGSISFVHQLRPPSPTSRLQVSEPDAVSFNEQSIKRENPKLGSTPLLKDRGHVHARKGRTGGGRVKIQAPCRQRMYHTREDASDGSDRGVLLGVPLGAPVNAATGPPGFPLTKPARQSWLLLRSASKAVFFPSHSPLRVGEVFPGSGPFALLRSLLTPWQVTTLLCCAVLCTPLSRKLDRFCLVPSFVLIP